MNIDDPKWRSPLTGSTKAVIMTQRAASRSRFAAVNVYIVALIKERAELAALEAE